MIKAIIYSSILLLANLLYSQTGPGGIGTTDGSSNLELWFDTMGIVTAYIDIDEVLDNKTIQLADAQKKE